MERAALLFLVVSGLYQRLGSPHSVLQASSCTEAAVETGDKGLCGLTLTWCASAIGAEVNPRNLPMAPGIAPARRQMPEETIHMKAIVVTDQAAGLAGMKLTERPEPVPAINDVIV